MKLISLVVPVYNESANIFNNLRAILAAADISGEQLELVAVDDGSADDSVREIARAAKLDARIVVLPFTRNFGKEAAILAGLGKARGAAVIVIDADLQHPPELIPKMIALWRQGVYVVDAVKQNRGNESLFSRLYARAFYAMFQRFAGLDLEGHSDFKLLDRVVVDAYLNFPERGRFFRGLIGWASYPSARLPFIVADRAGGGGSQWSRLKLFAYAVNNITSFSSLPLRLVSLLGFASLSAGVFFGAVSLIQKLNGQAIGGFTTLILLLVIIGGAILLGLGIIGHYIARLYDEIKARPSYIVRPAEQELP